MNKIPESALVKALLILVIVGVTVYLLQHTQFLQILLNIAQG